MLVSDFEKAQTFRNNGQIEEAVALYRKVRRTVLKSDPIVAAECLHMIGVAYYQIEEFKKAEKYLSDSLNELNELKNTLNASEFVGFVLRDLGANARGQKDFDKAKKYLIQSISALKKVRNVGHEGITRVKLGRVFADEGDFKEAICEINKGIKLLKKSTEKFFYSSAYLDRGKVYLQFGDKRKARKDAIESLDILNSLAKVSEFGLRRCDIQDLIERTNE